MTRKLACRVSLAGAMADRMIGGKPAEDVMAVRYASEALRFVAADPDLFARFRRRILTQGGDMPLGASRMITEEMSAPMLDTVADIFIAAMVREGYQ
jgi:hypothetical protein